MGVVVLVAVLQYLPTVNYSFVQDDRAIIVLNPAAHGVGAALRAFNQPYWPPPADAGLYRPVTILSFAVDWTLSGGRLGWLHLANAGWHGLACALVVLVLSRWLSTAGAVAAGLVFAVHPVHVEGVANLVSRNELLSTSAMLAAVLAARRHRWVAAGACALLAMLSKERGVVTGVVILFDDWLRPPGERAYPKPFYAALAAVTAAFMLVWLNIGRAATADVAGPFVGSGLGGRLAMALPAIWRAAELLIWPASLSADYSPQVIPYRTTISGAAVLGTAVTIAVVVVGVGARRRAPVLSFAALSAAAAYLPTSNLLFPSGIVLGERDLYVPVLIPAAAFGAVLGLAFERWPRPSVLIFAGGLIAALSARSYFRLPAWAGNRAFLLTLLNDHPECYRAQQSSAGLLAALGRMDRARLAYARADSLFGHDPHLKAEFAFFLIGQGDTTAAVPLLAASLRVRARDRVALRASFLLARARGDSAGARAVVDTALSWFPSDRPWYAGAGRQ